MQFYWYDHDAGGSGEPKTDGLKTFVRLFNAKKISTPQDFARGEAPKLGFIHAGSKLNRGASDWESVAADQAWIVRLSSEGLEPKGTPLHVHRLKMPGKDIAANLTEVTAKAFIQSCEKGIPDFGLFYPYPSDHLVALYLLEIANLEIAEIDTTKKKIRRAAENEYLMMRGADATLPKDRSQLLVKLREVLMPAGAK
jgi:hypothetical protein